MAASSLNRENPIQKILVTALGGTISLSLEAGRAKSSENISDLMAGAGVGGDAAGVEAETFASKDGPDITLEDLVSLARFIAKRRETYTAFIVSTGTDTLEEVAFGLDLLLGHSALVVVTGAMRPPYAEDFDGHRSISDAVALCQNHGTRMGGVYVAIGGAVIEARLAHKRSTSRLDAFVSTDPDKTCPHLPQNETRLVANLPELGQKLVGAKSIEPVDVPITGLSLGSIWNLDRYRDADGLVIACPGAASLAKAARPSLIETILPHMPVVLASRCEDSHADMSKSYPGYVDEMERHGFRVLEFCGLSPEKARLKLALEIMAIRT